MKRSVLGWSYKNLWNNILYDIYWRIWENLCVLLRSIDIFSQCSFITIFFLVENYEKWIISLIGTCSTRFLRVWKCFPREYYREAWIRLLMANHRGIFAEMKTAARLSRSSLKHSFFLVACASASSHEKFHSYSDVSSRSLKLIYALLLVQLNVFEHACHL